MIQEQHDFSTLSKILCKWEIRDSSLSLVFPIYTRYFIVPFFHFLFYFYIGFIIFSMNAISSQARCYFVQNCLSFFCRKHFFDILSLRISYTKKSVQLHINIFIIINQGQSFNSVIMSHPADCPCIFPFELIFFISSVSYRSKHPKKYIQTK